MATPTTKRVTPAVTPDTTKRIVSGITADTAKRITPDITADSTQRIQIQGFVAAVPAIPGIVREDPWGGTWGGFGGTLGRTWGLTWSLIIDGIPAVPQIDASPALDATKRTATATTEGTTKRVSAV